MKELRIFLSLLVLLIAVNSYSFDLNGFFNSYRNKDVSLCFKQISINAMTGQSIEKSGKMYIKSKEYIKFSYPNETIVIDNFKVIDKKDNQTQVYKLTGFNKVLFLMFVGKKDLNELFYVKRLKKDNYLLKPKYQSNIDSIRFSLDNSTKRLDITDIYSNQTRYIFYAACSSTQKRD
ncbi:LolA family protein [Hippea jasoniae]|uniref:LolA family protein n=1 Tax=Hippea jasoniae TaxID=944479 RepID=UPI0005546A47|nr:outer membrane lipoprotein carrier protein LolA [Hippea jasoniae]